MTLLNKIPRAATDPQCHNCCPIYSLPAIENERGERKKVGKSANGVAKIGEGREKK